MLDLIGLALVVIMSLGFVGLFQPSIEPGLSPLFWSCAGATLMIIIFKKMKKKREDNSE